MQTTKFLCEHDSWIFQSLRVAFLASELDDQALEQFLISGDVPARTLLDNWITAAELLDDDHAELLTALCERSASLVAVVERVRDHSS